ncbi:phage portal protein family protein [Sphingobacterium siyangense]|uniref:phage portal protein family protein n=1 Tax=Sphingobacterium siyangense TaxID=459529 RepID=UPI003017B038
MAKKNKNLHRQQIKSNPAPVIQNITVQPYNRQSSDLTNWRNATRAAEGLLPRRVYLYDLYHDYCTTDAQIIAVWGKRQDAITTAKWEFTDREGNPVDEINELIDCIGFEKLLKAIIDSKSWGYTMCEPTFFINDNDQNEFSLYTVPRKHMRPEIGHITKAQQDQDGIDINSGIYAKTIMKFGDETDLGLFLSATMYAILKRGNISDWAEFIEIFGRGIIDAEWDGFDESQRTKLAKTIQDMGGSGVIIRPAGTKVDIKTNTGNANGALQDTFLARMNAEISKALIGSTETTDSSKSSGYAQAEIHDKQDEKKNESDLDFVRRSLNSQFIKVLKAAGFDTKGGTFVLKKVKNLNKSAFDIHKSMRNDLGIPIDDDYFYEEYGVRKPDNYKELKNSLNTSKNKDIGNNTPEDKEDINADTPIVSKSKKDANPDESKEEKSKKLSFFRRLIRLFHPAPTSKNNQLVGAFGDHRTSNIKLAKFAAAKVWDSIKDRIIERAWTGAGKLGFDPELFDFTASALTIAFSEGWLIKPIKLVNIGIEYGVDDPVTMTAYEMNLFRFAGAKTLYDAQQLNELFRQVKNFREFYDNASAMLDVHNRDWLETEYNTAIAVGEMASTYNRLMNQKEDFPYWQYKTIGDERVRHSHTLLHDVVLPWNHPYWQYIMPPNGWGCRCYIVPRTKAEITPEMIKASEEKVREYMETAEFKKAAKGGWGINRFDKGQVFSENQHYTNDYLDVLSKMNKIDYRAFNLKPMEDNFNKTEFKPKFRLEQKDDAINDFTENLQKVTSKKYGIKDFNNRTITVDKATIRKHTTSRISKYQDRHMYLSEVEKVVNDPDEVWLQSYGQKKNESYVYVKYYQDQAIVVVCTLNDNLELQIETWHKLDDPRLRKGLLIKN